MRFAISLFTLLAIASIIGTVLKQNEVYSDYAFKFGQFWFVAFKWLSLYDVYHSWWFIIILTFLVASTSSCIYRNLPHMLREMRSYREHATEESLRHFQHQAEFATQGNKHAALQEYLTEQGYRFKENAAVDCVLLAAKRGGANRLGYMFTHGAIVTICIGGLVDGNIPLQMEQLLGYKHIETRKISATQVPAISRLPADDLSFRGDITIPEGDSADVIFINIKDGFLVQELPFRVVLNTFHIEHYSTGQPKAFASDIELRDKKTGLPLLVRSITVNHPLTYDGVTIFQSSFGDGGTRLHFNGWNLFDTQATPFAFSGVVYDKSPLPVANQPLMVEFTDFHPFNIKGSSADVMPKPKEQEHFGGNAVASEKNLHNVGPRVDYKIRQADGQAREYSNYMLPVLIDNRWFAVSGVRSQPNQPFQFLRMPLDPQSSLAGFMQLRGVMLNPQLYPQIAQQFAASVLPNDAVAQRNLATNTIKMLKLFASGGYKVLAGFLEQNVPVAQREVATQAYLNALELSAWQALNIVQANAHLPPPQMNPATDQYLRDSLNAISDIFFYGAPVYLQLTTFDQVQASGLQFTRSPGKNIVFFGSALLVLGVFTMFFVQERRLWLLIKPDRILLTMSSNRLTMDFDAEFALHRQNIAAISQEL